MRQNSIWIVEMWNDRTDRWGPTVGAALSRDDGRKIRLPEWQGKCPDDKFRLTRYQACAALRKRGKR